MATVSVAPNMRRKSSVLKDMPQSAAAIFGRAWPYLSAISAKNTPGHAKDCFPKVNVRANETPEAFASNNSLTELTFSPMRVGRSASFSRRLKALIISGLHQGAGRACPRPGSARSERAKRQFQCARRVKQPESGNGAPNHASHT